MRGALFLPFGLFVLLTFWVPPHAYLINSNYYNADLTHHLTARALTGTIASFLHLSKPQFLVLVQLFKLAWLTLVCWHFFQWVKSPLHATLLCVVFAFSSYMYSDNTVTGFVDCVANFWVAAAICYAIRASTHAYRIVDNIILFLLLLCALLTHEKTLFAATVLLGWMGWRGHSCFKPIVIAYGCLLLLYVALTWKDAASGDTFMGYYSRLTTRYESILHRSFNLYGIFSSIGLLWLLYAWLGTRAVLSAPSKRERYAWVGALFLGVLVHLAGLLMAVDNQRIIAGMWACVFILIYDRRTLLNEELAKSSRPIFFALLAALHVAIPPIFVVSQKGVPQNCYAKRALPYLKTPGIHGLGISFYPRKDLMGKMHCPM
jgi:hypothetical protein